MIAKTHAIPLRWWPVTNTSRIVTWLTRDFGRISTLIKGDQRPRSGFLGQYDILYRCELLFYTREREELHIARECTPLDVRSGIRGNWRTMLAGSYAASLCLHVAPTRGACPEIFLLLETFLRHLDRDGLPPGGLEWFELSLLHQLGLSPRLDHCALCGRQLDSMGDAPWRFSPQSGGALDPACGRTEPAHAVQIHPQTLALLSHCQEALTLRHLTMPETNDGIVQEMHILLRDFLAYHTDFPPHRRNRIRHFLRKESTDIPSLRA